MRVVYSVYLRYPHFLRWFFRLFKEDDDEKSIEYWVEGKKEKFVWNFYFFTLDDDVMLRNCEFPSNIYQTESIWENKLTRVELNDYSGLFMSCLCLVSMGKLMDRGQRPAAFFCRFAILKSSSQMSTLTKLFHFFPTISFFAFCFYFSPLSLSLINTLCLHSVLTFITYHHHSHLLPIPN